MPRFVVQRDDFRCGPIAVLNALKWYGLPATKKKHLRLLTEACDCHREFGTYWADMHRAITHYYPGSCQYVDFPSIGQLSDHVFDGGAFILRYCVNRKAKPLFRDGHVALCIDITETKRQFLFVNFYSGEKFTAVRRHSLKKLLRKVKSRKADVFYYWPSAWLLK